MIEIDKWGNQATLYCHMNSLRIIIRTVVNALFILRENQPSQVKAPQREPSFGASNLAGKGGIKWAVGIVLVCHSNANMGYPGE